LAEAEPVEVNDPNAIALATVDATGLPNVRMVLLKEIEADAFVFYTNYGSAKGQEITESGKAAFVMHWKSLRRQVRVRGEADAYFASRPKQSQIGAWASKQSQHLEGRFELEQRVAKFAAQYALFEVPRPEFWSGFRLIPNRIEFWMDQPFRLHDRVEYTRESPATPWTRQRLYP